MNNTRKVLCIYCGLVAEMPVVETGCMSDGKPIKMYKVVCPRCGQEQWTHDKGERE
jgi:ribosomal protein S27AE